MKIAIYHNLPSGGGKRALFEMTRRLAERHEIDVFTLSTADHDFCDLRQYCKFHVVVPFQPMPLARRPFGRLNQAIRTLDLQRLNNLQKGIARNIDAQGYDLVFAHVCQFNQSPAILQYLETPSAYYCHEPPRLLYEPTEDRAYRTFSQTQRVGNKFDPLPGIFRRTLARLDRKNVRAADLVLVNSQYSRETLYRVYGIFAVFSRLGVDTMLFQPLSVERKRMVVSVGAMTSKKGFDSVIRGLSHINAAERPTLTIVSNFVDPQEKAYLQALATQLSVVVIYCVSIPDEELVQIYNRAKLTVYAPIMEPFGFVPLESMACGTPVIGVREGGVRETIRDKETGLLVERDPAQFAAAALSLLDDHRERERLGKQARIYVEKEWSWERSVEDLEAHLQGIVRK